MNYTIFVINISDERWEKYATDTIHMYNRFKGVDGSQLDMEAYDHYVFYWNKNEKSRRSAIGCSESHMNVMKYIYENKVNNAIVIEDDAIIDFSRLSELDDVKGFCYIGGRLQATILKNDKVFQKEFNKDTFSTQKINKINPYEFIITGAHGLYFSNYNVAKDIYDDIKNRQRRRISDVELKRIQKTKPELISQFIYPAISTLHLPDAMNGFTYNKESMWKLNDNNIHY
jgi:GR25 family glycosyltransferase involved in LPS biosynthesis